MAQSEHELLSELLKHKGTGCFIALTQYLEVRAENAQRACTAGEGYSLYRSQGRAAECTSLHQALVRHSNGSEEEPEKDGYGY